MAKSKMGHSFIYQCPTHKGDRKREGRSLVISDGANAMTFDGRGIKVLKHLLKDVGEYGEYRGDIDGGLDELGHVDCCW